MPLHNRWARMAAAGFGLALILQPVLAQQPQPKEPEEIRRVIRIHDNGQEQTLEITQKDGKILLNGKPIEEASQADKALYEQFKEDEITVQDRKIRIFRDGNRNEDLIFESMPKRGYLQRDTIRVRSYRREGDDDTIREERMPNEDVRVFRWRSGKPLEEDEEVTEERELPRIRLPKVRMNWDGLENLRGNVYVWGQDGGLDELTGDLRMNLEDLRGGKYGDVARLEREARNLARDLKSAKPSEKANIERQLTRKLNEIFDLKQEIRRDNIERLEERLESEKANLRERERNRKDMVERRKQELVHGEDPMEW